MARVIGAIEASSNYELTIRKPFDARAIVPNFEDLTTESNWLNSSSKSIAYNGMLVAVVNTSDTTNNGVYYFFDPKFTTLKGGTVTSSDNWHKLCDLSELNEIEGRVAALESNLGVTTDDITDAINSLREEIEGKGYITADALSEYAKVEDIPTDYIKEIPGEYVTETELEEKGYLTEHQSLEGYATETYVEGKIAEAQLGGGEVDLSAYATTSAVEASLKEFETGERGVSTYNVGESITGDLSSTLITVTPQMFGYDNSNTETDAGQYLQEACEYAYQNGMSVHITDDVYLYSKVFVKTELVIAQSATVHIMSDDAGFILSVIFPIVKKFESNVTGQTYYIFSLNNGEGWFDQSGLIVRDNNHSCRTSASMTFEYLPDYLKSYVGTDATKLANVCNDYAAILDELNGVTQEVGNMSDIHVTRLRIDDITNLGWCVLDDNNNKVKLEVNNLVGWLKDSTTGKFYVDSYASYLTDDYRSLHYGTSISGNGSIVVGIPKFKGATILTDGAKYTDVKGIRINGYDYREQCGTGIKLGCFSEDSAYCVINEVAIGYFENGVLVERTPYFGVDRNRDGKLEALNSDNYEELYWNNNHDINIQSSFCAHSVKLVDSHHHKVSVFGESARLTVDIDDERYTGNLAEKVSVMRYLGELTTDTNSHLGVYLSDDNGECELFPSGSLVGEVVTLPMKHTPTAESSYYEYYDSTNKHYHTLSIHTNTNTIVYEVMGEDNATTIKKYEFNIITNAADKKEIVKTISNEEIYCEKVILSIFEINLVDTGNVNHNKASIYFDPHSINNTVYNVFTNKVITRGNSLNKIYDYDEPTDAPVPGVYDVLANHTSSIQRVWENDEGEIVADNLSYGASDINNVLAYPRTQKNPLLRFYPYPTASYRVLCCDPRMTGMIDNHTMVIRQEKSSPERIYIEVKDYDTGERLGKASFTSAPTSDISNNRVVYEYEYKNANETWHIKFSYATDATTVDDAPFDLSKVDTIQAYVKSGSTVLIGEDEGDGAIDYCNCSYDNGGLIYMKNAQEWEDAIKAGTETDASHFEYVRRRGIVMTIEDVSTLGTLYIRHWDNYAPMKIEAAIIASTSTTPPDWSDAEFKELYLINNKVDLSHYFTEKLLYNTKEGDITYLLLRFMGCVSPGKNSGASPYCTITHICASPYKKSPEEVFMGVYPNELKTINGQSLIGEGEITIDSLGEYELAVADEDTLGGIKSSTAEQSISENIITCPVKVGEDGVASVDVHLTVLCGGNASSIFNNKQ